MKCHVSYRLFGVLYSMSEAMSCSMRVFTSISLGRIRNLCSLTDLFCCPSWGLLRRSVIKMPMVHSLLMAWLLLLPLLCNCSSPYSSGWPDMRSSSRSTLNRLSCECCVANVITQDTTTKKSIASQQRMMKSCSKPLLSDLPFLMGRYLYPFFLCLYSLQYLYSLGLGIHLVNSLCHSLSLYFVFIILF